MQQLERVETSFKNMKLREERDEKVLEVRLEQIEHWRMEQVQQLEQLKTAYQTIKQREERDAKLEASLKQIEHSQLDSKKCSSWNNSKQHIKPLAT